MKKNMSMLFDRYAYTFKTLWNYKRIKARLIMQVLGQNKIHNKMHSFTAGQDKPHHGVTHPHLDTVIHIIKCISPHSTLADFKHLCFILVLLFCGLFVNCNSSHEQSLHISDTKKKQILSYKIQKPNCFPHLDTY